MFLLGLSTLFSGLRTTRFVYIRKSACHADQVLGIVEYVFQPRDLCIVWEYHVDKVYMFCVFYVTKKGLHVAPS